MRCLNLSILPLPGQDAVPARAPTPTKLGVDKSTISAWRSRRRIRERFVQLPEPERLPEIDIWPELHDRGTAPALARYVSPRPETVRGGDADRAIAAVLDGKPFWPVLNRAALDLRSMVQALKIDVSAALPHTLHRTWTITRGSRAGRDPQPALTRSQSMGNGA
jgi:hypothetical protein